MAKKNYIKYLPKAGGTIAVAVAMSLALSTQVNASELEDPNLNSNTPPSDPAQDSTSGIESSTTELPQTNEDIAQENADILEENMATAEENEQTEQENNNAAKENEEATNGELSAPDLDLPDAPETPDLNETDPEEYNEQVSDYNEQAEDYNEKVDEHNQQVDDYNEAADEYDEQAQEDYEEEKADYEREKAEHEEAVKQYEEEKQQHDEGSQAYQDYLDAKAKYEEAYQAFLDEQAAYETEGNHNTNSQAYQDYLAAKAACDEAYQKYLDEQAEYDEVLDDYNDQYWEGQEEHQQESEMYQTYLDSKAQYEQDMLDYQQKQAEFEAAMEQYEKDAKEYQDYLAVKAEYDNARQDYLDKLSEYESLMDNYEDQKEAYQNWLTAKEAYDLAKAEFDAAMENYTAEKTIYDNVSDYNEDIEDKNEAIGEKNEALEDDLHADNVDSIDDVGDINEDVQVSDDILAVLNTYDELEQQYNDLMKAAADLEDHAGKDAALGSDEYAAYLAAVDAYNQDVAAYNEAVDIYNLAVEEYNKAVDTYNANKEAESTTSTDAYLGQGDADWGNINIGNNTTFSHIDVKYTAAASKVVTVDAQGNKTYSDSITQYEVIGVYTDKASAERNPYSYGVSYINNDRDSTVHVQYMIKDDANNEFGTYTHTGAYLDPDEGQVSFYVTLKDKDGNTHGISVTMNSSSVYGENTYYRAENNDFLKNFVDSNNQKIPTVRINGVEYYDISGQSVFVISALTCDGMTKWLNLQPNGLDLVMNLQTMIEIHQADNAKKISYLGYELGKTAQAEAPTHPGEFTETDPGHMVPPTEPQMPTFTQAEPEPVAAPELPDAPNRPTPPDAPSLGTPPTDPGTFDRTEPVAPTPLQRLSYAAKLELLVEKVIVNIPEPEPVVQNDDVPVNFLPDGAVQIIDEEVPLADAPKTGDASMLFGAMGMFSAFGLATNQYLGRKKKDEE